MTAWYIESMRLAYYDCVVYIESMRLAYYDCVVYI